MGQPNNRRPARVSRGLALYAIAFVSLIGVNGYLLGEHLGSRNVVRIEAATQGPSLLSTPIESTALSNDVVLRGTAEFEGAIDLVLDPTLGESVYRVVTGQVPEIESDVTEGSVVIEVSGRPVFVLGGTVPGFRELGPDLEGDDVLQLEQALSRLGFLNATPDRLYDGATEAAVSAMYNAAGYEAPGADAEDEARLDAAHDVVKARDDEVKRARDALTDAQRPKSNAQIQDERVARRDLQQAVTDAKTNLDRLEQSLPSSERLALIAAIDRVTSEGGNTSQLNLQLIDAQIADRSALEAAQEQIARQQQALDDFQVGLRAAEADRDTSRLQDVVDRAVADLADAKSDLGELEAEIGVRLPLAEVAFVPDLPRTVTTIDVERGDFVRGPVMQISGTAIRIISGVSEANRPLLNVGQQVVIDNEALGVELGGEITELADRTGTNGFADTRYYMQVTLTETHDAAELAEQTFRVKVPLDKSEGEVLAVPLAALSQGADGSSRVELLTGDNTSELVPVLVGLQDKNRSLVEIKPLSRDLSAGDQVVIGIDRPQPADTATDEDSASN